MAEYTYDAWGKVLTATGTMAAINPLRYRGYYYDTETGLYYLQSRYYDPATGRFINADAFASTGQGILGANMFAYCGNCPACFGDSYGTMMTTCVNFTDGGGRTKSIRYDVPLYDQGSRKLCWATCQLMMHSYKTGVLYSPDEAEACITLIAVIDAIVNNKETWNSGGWPNDLGAKMYISSIEELYTTLLENGPVYAYYSEPEKKDPTQPVSAHMVIVTGVDLDRGIVFTNNPHGVRGEQSFDSFLSGYIGKNGLYENRYFRYINLVEGAKP